MIYILISIILLLSVAIVCLSINFRQAKSKHEKKVGEMEVAIIQLLSTNDLQLRQLSLSDDLREKLVNARETIDRDIFALQHDFIETLVRNRLVE